MTQKVHQRSLLVKANMTPADVRNAKNATPEQKAMANVFDANNDGKYSQAEANIFNSTLISDHGNGKVSLWTRYTDGTRKETVVSGDVAAYKHAPSKNVKPYVRKVAVKKTNVDTTKSLATQLIQNFEKTGKGKLNVGTYENGNIKFKKYKEAGYFGKEANVTYYENGKQESSNVRVWDNVCSDWVTTEDKKYYSNGHLKSSKTKEPKYFGKETNVTYYENGKQESSNVRVWDNVCSDWVTTEDKKYYSNGHLKSSKTKEPKYFGKETNVTYYENGKQESSNVRVWDDVCSDWVTTEYKKYYSNGHLKSSKTKEPKYFGKETNVTYHENGNPKMKSVSEWQEDVRLEKFKGHYRYFPDWVETVHIEYDSKGNVIKNARVEK